MLEQEEMSVKDSRGQVVPVCATLRNLDLTCGQSERILKGFKHEEDVTKYVW